MPIRRFLGRLMLKASGWTIEGDVPRGTSFVLAGGPHTSNWDFILFVMAVWTLGIKPAYIAKHTLFKPGASWFFRGLGGIPVDRSKPGSLVDQVTAHFHADDGFALVMAPDGTRSYRDFWKTGFLIIGRGAGVPIISAVIKADRKLITIGKSLDPHMPTSELMDLLRVDYEDGVGLKRSGESLVRLKNEGA
jgi:1-acyl-sn-glycerol-3-phosphate acyltransferase